MLGYDLDKGKGKLVPNKDAWIIRLIFQRLVEGATFQSIINELTEKKVTRMRSKAAWNVSSLLGILRNETYVGDKLLQKKPPLDFLTKRPDLTLDYDSYYLENDHEAIIDRETWEKAQERLDRCRQEKENGYEEHFVLQRAFSIIGQNKCCPGQQAKTAIIAQVLPGKQAPHYLCALCITGLFDIKNEP